MHSSSQPQKHLLASAILKDPFIVDSFLCLGGVSTRVHKTYSEEKFYWIRDFLKRREEKEKEKKNQ